MQPESIKDTQKTETLSRLLEQKGLRVNPFGENKAAERAYRRAERIAAGVYLITAHVPASEPVRASARASANKVLSDTLAIRDQMRSAASERLRELLSELRYLVSLARLLAASGFVSNANAEVLIEAIDELGHFIHASQKSALSESVSLSKEDMIDVRPLPARVAKDNMPTVSYRTDISAVPSVAPASDMSDKKTEGAGAVSVRVQNIVEVLKTGGSLGIKDIVANLPEYSEKMIQRELLDLVSRGAVKKTGNKRWSRYSIGV